MIKFKNIYSLSLIFFVILVAGCTGHDSVGTAARSGDTIVLSLGWQQELTRNNVQITITDSGSNAIIYAPGDPAVRSLFQSYPDPVSNLIVGGETGQNAIDGSSAGLATILIDAAATDGDKDYSQTFMVLDLPTGMQLGTATIAFADAAGFPISKPTVVGGNIQPINVEIIANGGAPDLMTTQDDGINIIGGYLKAMERSPHYTVTIQGNEIPYAVELAFDHNPDLDNGGVGRAYVANPRGDLKNISWNDDGTSLKTILIPSRNQILANIKQFKFYVAGGVTGLVLQAGGVNAYDVNGLPVTGVTATVN